MNYYELLNISKNTSPEDIKKAYQAASFKYHPDRNPGDKSAENTFIEVQKAYDVLSDLVKKSEYDRKHPEKTVKQPEKKPEPKPQTDLDSIKCQFFGGGNSGRNIMVHLYLTASELKTGTLKTVKWKCFDKCNLCESYGVADLSENHIVKCQACKGTGNSLGVIDKARIYPKCEICDGQGFSDMVCRLCLGSGLSKEMTAKEAVINVPPNTMSGHQITIRGKGEIHKTGSPGNLHVIILEGQI